MAWRLGNKDGRCGDLEEVRVPSGGRESENAFLVGDFSDAV